MSDSVLLLCRLVLPAVSVVQAPRAFLTESIASTMSPASAIAFREQTDLSESLVRMLSVLLESRADYALAALESSPELSRLVRERALAPLEDGLLSLALRTKIEFGLSDADYGKLRALFQVLRPAVGSALLPPLKRLRQRLREMVDEDKSGYLKVLPAAGTGRRISYKKTLAWELAEPGISQAIVLPDGAPLVVAIYVDSRKTAKNLTQTAGGHSIVNIEGACMRVRAPIASDM